MFHFGTVETILLLLLPVCGLMLLAERWRLPYPVLLVVGGAVLGFVPGLPRLALDPQVILLFVLPPLLYVAATTTSVHELRRNARPIGLLAFGLVFFTTGLVALAAHATVPAFTWPAAFALGAIVSPPDAVAAAAIFEHLGVPCRITSILQPFPPCARTSRPCWPPGRARCLPHFPVNFPGGRAGYPAGLLP